MLKEGIWFNQDPCGIMCGFLTYVLIIFADISTCRGISFLRLTMYKYSLILIYQFLVIMAVASHLACMFNDPGSVPRISADNSFDFVELANRKCNRCMGPKPSRAHHCSTCNRCILKMDHHCPWVNNCIGAYNQKHFLLFLGYINLLCGYSFGIIIWRTALCSAGIFAALTVDHLSASSCISSSSLTICLIITILLSVIFGLFTLVMMVDQISGIATNTTGIEYLQKNSGIERPYYDSFVEVFGCSFSWCWFVPTPVRPSHLKKVLSINNLQMLESYEVESEVNDIPKVNKLPISAITIPYSESEIIQVRGPNLKKILSSSLQNHFVKNSEKK